MGFLYACLQYWTDFYLQWNTSDYPGVTNVRFPDSQIWRPDILLYNRYLCAAGEQSNHSVTEPGRDYSIFVLNVSQCVSCTADNL